jgi:hypothetical protein
LGHLTIDPRFNGPPDSGNGGYVCGEIAKALETNKVLENDSAGVLETGVRVRLRQPPGLERDLEIAALQDDGWGLFDEETLIAQAWPKSLELAVPDSVSAAVATEAARSFRGHDEHVFPGCFVCGPERAVGDGLRIFPGRLSDSATSIPNAFAAPWQPDPSLEGRPGFVDPAFVWAALDCPGCFSFPQPEGAIVLLGEMTAALPGRIRIDEPSVLLSWQIEHAGRKHTTGSAIYDGAGECRGVALAMWIEIPAS